MKSQKISPEERKKKILGFRCYVIDQLFLVFSVNTMRIFDTHSLKQALNKWLIAIVLLVSVFAFSGLSTSRQAGPSPVQSTWIIRGSKPAVNGIQFSTSRPYRSKQHNAEFAGYSIVNLSLLHSKTCAVKLRRCQGSCLISSYKTLIGVHKTIPQNGKADPSILV